MGDVAVDDTSAWVTAFGPREQMRLLRIDPVTNRVVATVPIPGDWVREVFAFEGAIVVRSLAAGESRLTVIDPAINEVVASRPINAALDPGPFVEWDGALWTGIGRKLLRFRPETARPEGQPIPVGTTISWSSLLADRSGFWFVGYNPNRPKAGASVVRFNRDTGEIAAGTGEAGGAVRTVQSGRVQRYALLLFAAVGVMALAVFLANVD